MMEESIPHHISIDEITNPIEAQLFEFCESDLFPNEIQNTEPTSSSNDHNNNYCYEGETSHHPDTAKFNTTTNDNEINPLPQSKATSSTTAQNDNFTIIFDDSIDDQLEHDISINFSPSPPFSAPSHQYYNNNNKILNNNNNNNNSNNQELFNVSSLNNHSSLGDHHMMNGPPHQYAPNERWQTVTTPLPPPLVPVLGPSLPSYIRLRSYQPDCSLMDPMMPPVNTSTPFSAENSGIFTGGLMLGSDLSHQELDFQGDSAGLFLPDNLTRIFNCSTELQALSSESQHLVHGGTTATRLTSEISSLDDPTFKVGKLSVEERKRKIHRYLQKRNERNFSKKIKYACRKTLADSRPRVRGRFAKNDELGEMVRTTSGNHEDDIDDDVSLFSSSIPDHQRKVIVKEEEELESADIFAHISGVNSLKCNYPIQSWI